MENIQEILEKYWGHKHFRDLQEDIIRSVLDNKDTLALLPTGGGKSICFQVPALAQNGICIVVSPLIALMKDQVENLTKKGIKAIAITSAMHKREVDIALDNCVHGNIKFLYLSPERLESEIVKVRLKKMNVNLIAIDEAHCISQWGYDFRPSYRKIELLRELLPNAPILALTATATPEVVKDIQEQLQFKKKNVFQKSFERKNLAYAVLYVEDKLSKLVKVIQGLKGSGIVYARNRKHTQEISNYLNSNGISANFYHAGLIPKQRDQKQADWMQNKTRVMVCTNAFGMGIDKHSVKFVIHIDLPESIEAYFQEAGRAGRDEQKAYAILLYNENDKIELEERIETNFPSIDEIRRTYQALANHYQLAIGSGLDTTFDFDIGKFCATYDLKAITAFNCLKFIEREGYISTTESFYKPSKIKFEFNREELYRFQLSSPTFDPFIKLLLRSYAGLFDNFVKINEFELAQKAKNSKENVIKQLNYLHQQGVLTYLPQSDLAQLTYTRERVDAKSLKISKENYSLLKKQTENRGKAIINYASKNNRCRSQSLLSYFGETNTHKCNQCDVCLEEERKTLHVDEFELISKQIKALLSVHPMPLNDLVNALTEGNEDKQLKTIRWLLDNDELKYNNENLLLLNA